MLFAAVIVVLAVPACTTPPAPSDGVSRELDRLAPEYRSEYGVRREVASR